MAKISFSHNWNNKLDCTTFTTLRRYTPNKFRYYKDLVGKDLDLVLQDEPYGMVNLLAVDTELFRRIPRITLRVDTGITDVDEINSLFRNFGINGDTQVLILTFKKKED